jgi:hypothetical protein
MAELLFGCLAASKPNLLALSEFVCTVRMEVVKS